MRVMVDVGDFILTQLFNSFKSTAGLVSPHYQHVSTQLVIAAPSAKLSEKTAGPLLSGYPDPECGKKQENLKKLGEKKKEKNNAKKKH